MPQAEFTTVNLEKPTANELRKLAIDGGEDIRDMATRVIKRGLPIVRDEIRSSRRHNTTNQ